MDWEQCCRFLLLKVEEYRGKFPVKPPVPIGDKNAYMHEAAVEEGLNFRLDTKFHRFMTEESSLNTFR